jgi:ssDNA-binding Zn-finger/Zn-ribbon topoisomerase 1
MTTDPKDNGLLEGGNVRFADLFKPLRDDTPVVEDVSMDDPLLTKSIYPCERRDLKCGECGAEMRIHTSKKFANPFYGCSRFPDCKGSHGAHRDGRPLGIPANKVTKMARIRAHRVFDLIWKERKMSRGEAYAWMRRKMKLSEDDAHIGKFTLEQCEQLITDVRTKFPFVRTSWDRLEDDPFEDVAELSDD